jgi:hypothetical protein
MDQMQEGTFEEAIGRARSKYELFRQFASRTHKVLREALEELYALLLKIRSDEALRTAFYRALVSQNMRIGDKEELLLVEYAFFPHVLLPGKDHRDDINKASRYNTLIKKALAANISPTDFVAFARKETALANAKRKSQPAKRSEVEIGEPANLTADPSNRVTATAEPVKRVTATAEPVKRVTPTAEPVKRFTAVEPPASWDTVLPGEVWFNSTGLAQKAVEFVRAAKAQRQRGNIEFYFDGERTVVTGIAAEPWHGPFPMPKVAPIGSSIADAPAARAGGKVGPKTALRPTPIMRAVPPSMAVPGLPRPKQSPRLGKAPWRPKS